MFPAERARLSLEGLSVGDAFGETFVCTREELLVRVRTRRPPPGPLRWTDDTEMALSVLDELVEGRGRVHQDRLAQRFATRMDPQRGYGAGADRLLREVREGTPWQRVARGLFGGIGSFGNGAAMRVAPLGAYHAEDMDTAVREAARSAEVTHAHPEGIAGAVAVAVAAVLAWRSAGHPWDAREFLRAVAEHTPAGYTRDGMVKAAGLALDTDVVGAATALGNGSGVTAPDTVPFALWSLAQWADSYEEALWHTAMGLGDVDTTCAIAGGVLVLRTGLEGIPAAWRDAREPLPG